VRGGPARACVALAAVSAVAALPFGVRNALRDTLHRDRLSRAGRELAPAVRVGVDPAALVAAARLLPPDARYYVAATPALAEAARPMTFYWLFPRRYVDEPAAAGWLLCFGRSPRGLGVAIARTVRLGPGILAAEVER
jgi:hypothetical protein